MSSSVVKSITGIFLLILYGCASISVSKVTDPNGSTEGVRYSLPKPCLIMAPQADGSVTADVIYLPDTDNTYAISTWSLMSSYAFQASIDQSGLLNAVEFKQSTSAVGQQVAASAGAMSAQAINLQNAQMLASQGITDTAQASVDSAQTTRDVDENNLRLLLQQGLSSSDPKLQAAQATLEADEIKLKTAKAVLQRARDSTRVVASGAAAGTPVSTTSETPSAGWSTATWTQPSSYNIYGEKGAVLYCIDETPKPKSTQKAGPTLNPALLDENAQPSFETAVLTAPSAAPKVTSQNLQFQAGKQAIFVFSSDVSSINSFTLTASGTPGIPITPTSPPTLLKDSSTLVTMPLAGLSKGTYQLELDYSYDKTNSSQTLTFSIK